MVFPPQLRTFADEVLDANDVNDNMISPLNYLKGRGNPLIELEAPQRYVNLTSTQREALPASVKQPGTTVYDTTFNALYTWNGIEWTTPIGDLPDIKERTIIITRNNLRNQNTNNAPIIIPAPSNNQAIIILSATFRVGADFTNSAEQLILLYYDNTQNRPFSFKINDEADTSETIIALTRNVGKPQQGNILGKAIKLLGNISVSGGNDNNILKVLYYVQTYI